MTTRLPLALLAAALAGAPSARAADAQAAHATLKDGYQGPATCEKCHPGVAKAFLDTVHWKHASKVTNVDHLDPRLEYGMRNSIYTFCNGNDVVNDLKQIPANDLGKTKITGCNSCHHTLDHGFIAIQRPTSLPYSNQNFAPQK